MKASYREIGHRIVVVVEAGEKRKLRARYGEPLVARLFRGLPARFKRGFRLDSLESMQRIFPAYSRSLTSETMSRRCSLVELRPGLYNAAGRLPAPAFGQRYRAPPVLRNRSPARADRVCAGSSPEISSQFYERHCPEIRPRCWQSISHCPGSQGERNLSAGTRGRPLLIGEISALRSPARRHRDAHSAFPHSTLTRQFCPDLDASAR
jgi:hypothetical protein